MTRHRVKYGNSDLGKVLPAERAPSHHDPVLLVHER